MNRRAGIVLGHPRRRYADRLGNVGGVGAPGDSVTVWKLDRLGRSTSHLLALLDELGERDVDFRCLTEAIDTRTAGGRLVFTMLAAVAQFERDLNRERTAAALVAARERGVRLGRRPRITPGQWQTIRELADRGLSHRAIADRTGIPRATIGRALRGQVDTINHYDQPLAYMMESVLGSRDPASDWCPAGLPTN